jgi:hypothetical protein
MSSGHELTDAEYAALADFRRTLRQFQAFSEERAADFGLTPQQHQVLLTIRGASPRPVSIGADRASGNAGADRAPTITA